MESVGSACSFALGTDWKSPHITGIAFDDVPDSSVGEKRSTVEDLDPRGSFVHFHTPTAEETFSLVFFRSRSGELFDLWSVVSGPDLCFGCFVHSVLLFLCPIPKSLTFKHSAQ